MLVIPATREANIGSTEFPGKIRVISSLKQMPAVVAESVIPATGRRG
jgi:hypothetical protein